MLWIVALLKAGMSDITSYWEPQQLYAFRLINVRLTIFDIEFYPKL